MIIGNNLETLRAELKKKVLTDKVKELNIKEEQEEEEKIEEEEEALFTDEEEDSIEEEVRGKGGKEEVVPSCPVQDDSDDEEEEEEEELGDIVIHKTEGEDDVLFVPLRKTRPVISDDEDTGAQEDRVAMATQGDNVGDENTGTQHREVAMATLGDVTENAIVTEEMNIMEGGTEEEEPPLIYTEPSDSK